MSFLPLAACEEAPAPAAIVAGTAYIIPYGDVPAEELRRAEWALADLTGRPVVLLPARPLPAKALSADCRDARVETPCAEPRYDAAALLDATLRGLPDDTFRALGVTIAPLDTPGHESLIGFARSHERGMVYSARAPGVYLTEAAHRRRVRHVVAHELGHTYGASHCQRDCVMRDVLTAADVDLLTEHPCRVHGPDFERGRALSIADAGFKAAVGAEQMRIGAWAPAVAALQRAVVLDPKDARHRTALGVALMGQGRLLAADDVLRDAAMQAPGAPQPYYARAVLYAAGFDPYRASAHLEAGVARDGDPVRAHRAAGILYQDVLDHPKAAIRHFEAHIQYGGRDPEVIARLVYLLSPTTLTFHTPEVIIARWEPGRGLMVAAVRPHRAARLP